MPRKPTITPEQAAEAAAAHAAGVPYRELSKRYGVSHTAVARAITLAERIKDRVRTKNEFKAAAAGVRAPRSTGDVHAWSLETIRRARDEQMAGKFALPTKLAATMRTNGELFTAYHTRTAPVGALGAHLKPGNGARGTALQRKAQKSVIIPRGVLLGLAGTRANHGIAIGHVVRESNAEGTLVDMRLEEWPLEFVRWDASREMLMTRTDGGPDEPIIHGDGEWIVFKKYDLDPWKHDACVLPGGLLWAALAGAIKDWNLGATSHGQAKMIARLPEGFALQNADGSLTAEASSLIALLQGLVSGENGAGIVPFGTEVDFVSNNSSAWQVFSQLVDNREKIATRIYLGTDAILGATGGAPGVDIAALFRVASTIVQGDLDVICDGINVGMLQPWAAINDGDSRNAPTLEFRMPDPDAAAVAAERDAKEKQLLDAIERRKAAGFEVSQAVVNELASVYGVSPAPTLASTTPPAAFTLAPTDLAKVIRGREARASAGLPPFNDARDDMTLDQIAALANATGQAQAPSKTGGETPNPKALSALAGFDESKHPRDDDGKFGPGGAGAGGSNGDGGGGSKNPDSIVAKFKDDEKQITEKAAERAAALKTEAKTSRKAADKAYDAVEKRHGGTIPKELVDASNAENDAQVAERNSGGRGTNAFSEADAAKKRQLANSKRKAAADAGISDDDLTEYNKATDLEDRAQEIESEYERNANYVKRSKVRQRLMEKYEKARAAGNGPEMARAREALADEINDDTLPAGETPPSISQFIDGDGDGKVNEEDDE